MGRVIVNEVPMAAAVALLRSEQDRKVLRLVEQFAHAMVSGELEGLSRLFAVPASATDLTEGIAIGSAEPHVDHVDWLNPQLASVRVRWPYLDHHGNPDGREDATLFIVRISDKGVPRIVAIATL